MSNSICFVGKYYSLSCVISQVYDFSDCTEELVLKQPVRATYISDLKR